MNETNNINSSQNKAVNKTLTQQIFHPGLFNRPRSQSLSECRSTNVQNNDSLEVSTQPNQNSAGTSWTEVPNRKRQRDSPENDSRQKQTKVGTYWLSQPLPTSNSFSVLETEEEVAQTQQVRVPKPPPIFIDKVTNIRPLTQLLEETVEGSFELKVLPKNQVKIQPSSKEAFKTIVKELDAKGTEYFTYKPKQERSFKVILKNMHPSTDTDEIKEALANLDHSATNIWNIKQGPMRNPLHMFVVELQPKTNNKDIYNTKSLLHCRIKFEPPKPKRTIPQCTNCLAYGHTKTYCRRNPRCIKCAGNHASIDCIRKERSDNVKCALCDGNHPANYKGCSVYKDLQKQKFPPLRNKTFTRTNIAISESKPQSKPQTHRQFSTSDANGQPQPQLHSQNINYAAAASTNPTQNANNKPPKTQRAMQVNQAPVLETPKPSFKQPQQTSRDDSGDFKELMEMFKQMMHQMTTMTNLLLNFMTELRTQNSNQGMSQDFIQGGGNRPTLPPRGYTHTNR